AFSAVKNNDKVGLLIHTDQIEKFVPPKKGKSHVLRVVREILYFKPLAKKTNLKAALEHLYRILTRSAVIFVISDFTDSGYEKALKILHQKHDLIAIQITDEREETLPDCGWMELQDAETGELALVNTSDRKFRESYFKTAERRQEQLDLLFKLTGIDAIKIVPGISYIDPLIKFFLLRERRKR
ncbi:MAG: VWA domain-containing protein, partial [Candidatus Omnitrophica bacterium]|nr:VWA domain-containing protein [Candidatus Omnitrophota bacterium]